MGFEGNRAKGKMEDVRCTRSERKLIILERCCTDIEIITWCNIENAKDSKKQGETTCGSLDRRLDQEDKQIRLRKGRRKEKETKTNNQRSTTIKPNSSMQLKSNPIQGD